MRPIAPGIMLCLALMLAIPVVHAGNTSSYRFTYNGSVVISSSEPSTTVQVDDPSVSDTPPADSPAGDTAAPPPETGAEPPVVDNSLPVANHDSISTAQDTPAIINVLANDGGLNDAPLTVTILTPPGHGQAITAADFTVTYIPDNGYTGTDSMIYEIIDNNGDRAIANAAIEVQCILCPADILLTLSWTPNADDVLGYAVYFGSTVEGAIQLASELPLNSGLLDALAPSIQYHLGKDLGLAQGDSICFRLRAYNESGYSDYSAAACVDSLI